jgi:hypothetical protein
MRRTHLRGHDNILKRQLIHVGAFNLSLILLAALPDRDRAALPLLVSTQLAAEEKPLGSVGVVKRFLAETVTRQQDRAFLRIPNAERKHAAQFAQTFGPFS